MNYTNDQGVYMSNSNFWKINWIATTHGHSVTEGGSSGSPLLNSNHRVIGQLYGAGYCANPNCSDPSADIANYGKFSVSWTGNGATDSRRRLRDWLDPAGTNPTTLDGRAIPTLSGPSEVCYSGSAFTLTNAPAGTTTWSVTGPFTVSGSGTTVTVTRTGMGNGNGTLSASISGEVIASETITPCPPPLIMGPDTACPGDIITFFVRNPPANYTWGYSSNLTPVAGRPGTFTVSSAGGRILVSILTVVNGSTMEVARKTLLSGTSTGSISAPYDLTCNCQVGQVYSGNSYRFYAENISSGLPSSYITWEVIPPAGLGILPAMYMGYSPVFKFPFNGTYTVQMRWRGDCGTSAWRIKTVHVIDNPFKLQPYSIYPNPVSDILHVDTDTETPVQYPAATVFDIRLYDSYGVLLRQQKTGGGTVQFNVSNLPNGLYYLHVYDGVNKTPEVRQIMVKHD